MHDHVNVHVHELRPASGFSMDVDVDVGVDVHVNVIGFFIGLRRPPRRALGVAMLGAAPRFQPRTSREREENANKWLKHWRVGFRMFCFWHCIGLRCMLD